MKKTVKVVMALALIPAFCAGFFSCSRKEAAKTEKTDLKPVKIAVEIYDPTDSEFLELKSYFDYLSQNMPVSFVYSEAIASAEDEASFIENSAISGCQGYIGYYCVTDDATMVKTVTDYKMYFWGGAADKAEVQEANKDNKYLLGDITYGANGNYAAGYSLGEYAVKAGCKNIVFANGGADFGVQMFVERQDGFKGAIAELGKDVNVITVSGFPGDAFFADQASALTKNIDAVCASFNGVDFWAQPIASAGKKDTVKLATIGSLNESFVKSMEDGSVAFLASADIQRFGLGVGIIFNAVNGNSDVYRDKGNALVEPQGYWLIDSVDKAETLLKIQTDEKVYSAQDVLSLCTAVNPNAGHELFNRLIASGSLESLMNRKNR